ncbi:glycosyltransferase family 2 protein [Raineyella sp.]|uniref:Undecaprenyl-phosphate 4-deoxy-4-formamido-L-arabinose transferase n=1 Tax=bioreactor metagenome TaxID=1076179 RepID=A0A644XHV4_9ZZZZ|nr:glycosyltransferase [Raineyella sp.]MEA5153974.1 glycosyltransferase [Raineyella sp.]
MTSASVVIPSRGGAERLPRLLSALAAQDYPDWEAIVVIDGDIDGSQAVVEEYAHLPIRPIVFPENRGRVAALNAGFAEATGDVLIRCDDDLVPRPDFIAEHVRVSGAGDRAAVGLCLNVLPDTPYARIYGRPADAQHARDAYELPAHLRYRLWAANCSLSRALYEILGGYDSRYHAYGWEDVDFGYRLSEAGVPIELLPGLETPHYAASVTTAIRVRRAYASGEARWLFDSIHGLGVSGPAGPTEASLWNRMVNTLADHLTDVTAQRLARIVDGLLPVIPTFMGRKAVAAVVEASGVAGYRSANDVSRN